MYEGHKIWIWISNYPTQVDYDKYNWEKYRKTDRKLFW